MHQALPLAVTCNTLQVAYSACDDLVASCSYDKSVRLWSVGASRGTAAATLSGHDAPVLEMDIGGDGRIVTGESSCEWERHRRRGRWECLGE